MTRRLTILLASCLTLFGAHALFAASASADKSRLTVMRAGTRPVIEGPAANFTGKATIDRQVRPDASQRIMGSLVSFEPGARHGAQPNAAMSHYAIVEPLNGNSAEWMEKVSDEQYQPGSRGG